jgi:serine/threonine protein kinase
MAPELLRCTPAARNRLRLEGAAGYGSEVDCWAIGCLAFESLVGQTPLEGAGSMEKALAFMETGRLHEEKILPWLQDASDDAKDFILGCLDMEPSSRLTAQEMLCHPWIVKHHPHLSIPTTTVPDLRFDSVTSAADYMPPSTGRRSRERSERPAGVKELQAATEGHAQTTFANQHRWSSMPSGMSLAGDVDAGMLNLSNKFTTTSAGKPYAIHDPHSDHNLHRSPSPGVVFPSRTPSPMTVIGESSTRLMAARAREEGARQEEEEGDFHIPSPGAHPGVRDILWDSPRRLFS